MYLKVFNALSNHPIYAETEAGKCLSRRPLGFIDIGARGGVHDLVEPIAKHVAVLGFEPDEQECERLMAMPEVREPWAKFVLKPVALADKKGKAELKLLSSDTNHSLLSPNKQLTSRYNMVKWEEVGKCELQTDTLDAVLSSEGMNDFPWGEFMKIDTQGTEYEILQGAEKTLKEQTVAVIAEVAFCELYKEQKLFSDVEMLMRQYGFSFYGFTNLHTRSKKYLDKKTQATRERLIYTDAIFFKDPLPGGYVSELSERGCYSLFTIAILLGFYDYALELAKSTWFKVSDQAEIEHVENMIKDIAGQPTEHVQAEITKLVAAVKQNPDWANVAVGGFVDKRRHYCDYDDVLNVSPLPKTL